MSQNRKNWSVQEDEAMRALVKRYGGRKWSLISDQMKQKFMGSGRTGKQCRQRWYNHLCPKINKEPWSQQQIQILFKLHQKIGNRWTQISTHLKGRTDNSIKNQYYSTLRKGLRRMYRILGTENSTSKIKKMKPKDLSNLISNFSFGNIQDQHEANQFYAVLVELANQDKYESLQTGGGLDLGERDRLVNVLEKFLGAKQKCINSGFKKNCLKKKKHNQPMEISEVCQSPSDSIFQFKQPSSSQQAEQVENKFDFQIDFESSGQSKSPISINQNRIYELSNYENLEVDKALWYQNPKWKQKKDSSFIENQEQDCLTRMLKKSSFNEQVDRNKNQPNQCQQNLYQCFFAVSPVAGLQIRTPLSSKTNFQNPKDKDPQNTSSPDQELNEILKDVKSKVSLQFQKVNKR